MENMKKKRGMWSELKDYSMSLNYNLFKKLNGDSHVVSRRQKEVFKIEQLLSNG
jgi:hypothetical protein